MSERYETLLQAWRKERHTSDIQSLPDSFLANMTNYVSEMREGSRMLDKGSLRGKIVEKEKENAERMLGELTQIRLRKIIVAELDGTPISGSDLTREEKALHSDLRRLLSGHDERVKSILRGRVPKVEAKPQPEPGLRVVRFLQAVPAIMGIDMKTYGPFEPEDVASIPAENAENLIRRGIAKGVEIRE
jgi:DNA replication initiation complex subunit (GINS family)